MVALGRGYYMLRWSMLLVLAFLFGCASKRSPAPTVVYSVTGYDASSNTWVLDRTDASDKTHTEFVLACDFYKVASNPEVTGPTACDLTVGEHIVPNPLQSHPGEFIDVWPRQNVLSITRGVGNDQIVEQFKIKSAKTHH